jgi:hypothetical protein
MHHSWESVYCALVSVCRYHYQRVSHSDKSFKRERARVTRHFLQDLLAIVGKLLATQDGGVLYEGIRPLSEALMEMEV